MRKMTARLFRRFNLVPQGLRAKVVWTFTLMSAIPLFMLICVAAWFALPRVRAFYQLDRWFPLIANPAESTWWLLAILALTVCVSLLGGIYLMVKLIAPVIRISRQAKHLAEDPYDTALPMDHDDELGDITTSLNRLTEKIRDSMNELKQFGERTNQINVEINKRMLVLSGLFQIGELLGGGAPLETVLDLVVEKLAVLEDGGFSFLCLQPFDDLSLKLRRAAHLDVDRFDEGLFNAPQTLIDHQHPPSKEMGPLWGQLGRPNLILQPIIVRNRRIGLLGVGNYHERYVWTDEWAEVVGAFMKQTSMAIDNEQLLRKTNTLAVRDELTGVYNERYIRQRLVEEIKRAVMHQRPCALALFRIRSFLDYRQRHGEPEGERALKKVARLIQESVSEIDRVGRVRSNEMAVVLPERNKRQTLELVEQICQRVAFAFVNEQSPHDRLTLVSGTAENPLDGVTADDLTDRATERLERADVEGHAPSPRTTEAASARSGEKDTSIPKRSSRSHPAKGEVGRGSPRDGVVAQGGLVG